MQIVTVSDILKRRYGTKVLKLSLSSGCSCPNRDGTVGLGGCSFCSEGGSGEFAAPFLSVKEQIRCAKALTDKKFPASMPVSGRKYIAYFQSFSNTYGSVERLEPLYREVLGLPEIVILSVATRPDCLPDEMIDMIVRLDRIKPVWVELGLQTANEKTASSFGRGYTLDVFEEAYRKLTGAGITVIVHVILGLPGESREDMLNTVRYLSELHPALPGIKLQLLQILKGTRMETEYLRKPFPLMTMDAYTSLVVDCLKILPEGTVIHRMTGDPPRKLLTAPGWSTDKKQVLNMLRKKIEAADRNELPGSLPGC